VVDRLATTKARLRKASIKIQATKVFDPTETFVFEHAFIGNKEPLSMLRMLVKDMVIAQIPVDIDLVDANGKVSKILCSTHLLKQAFCDDSRVPEYA
jgi:hypothetical protein